MTLSELLILVNVLTASVILTQEVRLIKRKKEMNETVRLLIDLVRVLDNKGIIEIVERGEDDE